jgi:hypothetical protein
VEGALRVAAYDSAQYGVPLCVQEGRDLERALQLATSREAVFGPAAAAMQAFNSSTVTTIEVAKLDVPIRAAREAGRIVVLLRKSKKQTSWTLWRAKMYLLLHKPVSGGGGCEWLYAVLPVLAHRPPPPPGRSLR